MDKRVVIRVLISKLDLSKLSKIAESIEAVADEYGDAEVEYTVLPDRPGV